jgi:hypothetical protein
VFGVLPPISFLVSIISLSYSTNFSWFVNQKSFQAKSQPDHARIMLLDRLQIIFSEVATPPSA